MVYVLGSHKVFWFFLSEIKNLCTVLEVKGSEYGGVSTTL